MSKKTQICLVIIAAITFVLVIPVAQHLSAQSKPVSKSEIGHYQVIQGSQNTPPFLVDTQDGRVWVWAVGSTTGGGFAWRPTQVTN